MGWHYRTIKRQNRIHSLWNRLRLPGWSPFKHELPEPCPLKFTLIADKSTIINIYLIVSLQCYIYIRSYPSQTPLHLRCSCLWASRLSLVISCLINALEFALLTLMPNFAGTLAPFKKSLLVLRYWLILASVPALLINLLVLTIEPHC